MDASTAIQAGVSPPPPAEQPRPTKKPTKHWIVRILEFIASLKITVTLFALSMVLVFVGTLAQVDSGIWDVVNKYFRSVIVWIPLKVLTWYSLPVDSPINKICVPYPGGWLLGGLLLTNLLAAHIVRFRLAWNRAGIIVLHFGIILMMLGEWVTGMYAIEGMMNIRVGETVNWVQDNRSLEFAIVDVTDPKRTEDDIVAAYLPAILKGTIAEPGLPFSVEVKRFMKNTDIKSLAPGETPAAPDGHGRKLTLTPRPEVSGTDPDQKIDDPAVVVELKAKDGSAIGTYALSFLVGLVYGPEQVKVGDKTYEMSLRPRRSYRDFTVRLDKADERKHPNTQMARDFSSYITLNDPAAGVADREYHIWMNHPLRYRGETFFQANMSQHDGVMVTGLQVVRNPGWILPYVSCAVVSFGMLLHFGINLWGFLHNRSRTSP